MVGSVVSLHSIYLASAVVSAIIAIACAFPALQWAREGPKRRDKAKEKNLLNDMGELRRCAIIILETMKMRYHADAQTIHKYKALVAKYVTWFNSGHDSLEKNYLLIAESRAAQIIASIQVHGYKKATQLLNTEKD